MSIRVAFDVGHSATVKGKTTVEGFTHDWELYVRGIDSNSNIHRFVERVVFNLHESFPKPKRGKWFIIMQFHFFCESHLTSKLPFVISAVYKEPPYLLKECGYAGFELDIDIYFRCQRDEQKKITFRYDLTLPSKGATSLCERRYHTFHSPSSEFRRKLLDGGGVVVYPNASSNDDRSRDAIEDRTQLLSKPKLGSCGSMGGSDTKKHKIKSSQDDSAMKQPSSTFANLFGTPITKLSNSKQSPEQKLSNNSGSSSNNTKLASSSSASGGGGGGVGVTGSASASSGNSSKQISQKSSASSSSKDKLDKSSKSKKEKNKVSSSPMKDGKESTSSKKSSATSSGAIADDKHQRRDDIRREKSHNKDRERSKDKPSKRPASPKALPTSRSPKRSASPSSRNSSSNRHLSDGLVSASQSSLTVRHAEEKASSSNSSTNKKSKKEKRDKSFEKERERGVDGKKDGKPMATTTKQSKDEKPLSKSLEKINGTSKREKDGGGGSGNSTPKEAMREKSSSSTNAKYRQVFDAKIDSPVELKKSSAASSGLERENKKMEKHDGSDRKHKHKKKDKKEKGRSGSKDRKREKEKVTKAGTKEVIDETSTSSTTNHKRSYGQTPPLHGSQAGSGAKGAPSTANLISTATSHSKLSDDSSSDFDMDDDYPTTTRPSSPPPVKHEKLEASDSFGPEQSNTIGLPGVVTKVSPSQRAPLSESPTKQTKKSGKESKLKSSMAATTASKDEFQVRSTKDFNAKFCEYVKTRTEINLQGKKRGCKHSSSSSKRKTQSPANNEPPMKIVKKDQIKSESNRDGLSADPLSDGKYVKTESYFPSRSDQQHQHQHHQQSLQSQQSANSQHQQQIQSDSITSNSSISLPNLSSDSFRSPSEPTPVDYISQLRTLQQKIMALQDNSELQQVVEMIAATGCYEITSRTFDFDLCALDRTTVQRLQDFFSQSAVIK